MSHLYEQFISLMKAVLFVVGFEVLDIKEQKDDVLLVGSDVAEDLFSLIPEIHHIMYPRKLVLNEFDKGNNVIIQTEPDRAAQIKRNMPEAVCILVYPFDSEILKTRYTEKARSSFEVSVRTEVALKQIYSSKLFCDWEVDSGDADKACKEIISIINGN